MWNDTDNPIAFLITFRTYGTWLHGDERGSVDRHQNTYKQRTLDSNPHWRQISASRMKQDPVKLNGPMRATVEDAIRETCAIRNWHLAAINVRTNHAHSVAKIGANKPSIALNAFKANATRLLRERGLWVSARSPWVDKGSCRWLWTEKHVVDAVEYVMERQGDDLPGWD
jgi:REP element-mobilizing transposase RayT